MLIYFCAFSLSNELRGNWLILSHWRGKHAFICVFKNKQNLLSAFAMQMFSLNTNWRQRLLMSVMTMFISFSAKCKSFRLVENVRRCSELVRCTSFFGSENKRFNRFDRCQVIILEFKSIFAVQFDNIKWLKTI